MHFQVTNIKQWAALLLALFVFTAASTHLYIQDPLWAPHFYLQWRKYHKKVNGNRTNRIRIKTSRQLLVSARPFSICVPGRRAWQTTFPSKTFLNLCLVHSSFFFFFFFAQVPNDLCGFSFNVFFSEEDFLNFLSKLNHPAVISDYNVLFSYRICDTY